MGLPESKRILTPWPPPHLTSQSSLPWGASSPDTHLISLRGCVWAHPRGIVSRPCPGATHSLVGRIVTQGAIRVPQAEERRLQVAGAPGKTSWRRWCWHRLVRLQQTDSSDSSQNPALKRALSKPGKTIQSLFWT